MTTSLDEIIKSGRIPIIIDYEIINSAINTGNLKIIRAITAHANQLCFIIPPVQESWEFEKEAAILQKIAPKIPKENFLASISYEGRLLYFKAIQKRYGNFVYIGGQDAPNICQMFRDRSLVYQLIFADKPFIKRIVADNQKRRA